MTQEVKTDKAPAAIGPYSQGIQSGNIMVTSGQLPINAATGSIPEDIRSQTKQSLENCKAVLEAAGLSMGDVIKTSGTFPARSAFQVARLPKDALVEIECLAVKP